MNLQTAKRLEKRDLFELTLENDAVLKAKTVILSTGARWRNVGVPGEQEFKNKGVAYCPHCDGPLFEGKDVAVIGGGNSGIEAAIDLAGIVKHVTVLEFAPELKADRVLQDRLHSLPNVTVITNAQTTEITGDSNVNVFLTKTAQQKKSTMLNCKVSSFKSVLFQIQNGLAISLNVTALAKLSLISTDRQRFLVCSRLETVQTVHIIKLLSRWGQAQQLL